MRKIILAVLFLPMTSLGTNFNARADRFYHWTEIVEEAANQKNCNLAVPYSKELLKEAANWEKNWNYGNAIYVGNMTLGYCEAVAKNYDAAIAYLKLAGNTPGSPQLGSFGLPATNLSLLQVLLDKGYKQPVIDFLNQSRKFWKFGNAHETLDAWIETINSGYTLRISINK